MTSNDTALQQACKQASCPRAKHLDGSSEKTPSVRLLDLPLDVLKEVVKEITDTNDLTSLALTCSTLNNLATPWIYLHFNIAWPDPHSPSASSQAVDALTYGLATLVMGVNPIDSPAPLNCTPGNSSHNYHCVNCGKLNAVSCLSPTVPQAVSQKRIGNHYALYTREFSLGSGQDKRIDEYVINKDSGKMLGTLVALAVARMPNLETFIWNVPTGILRDCWRALGFVNERGEYRNQSLQKVWVRFHDNADIVANIPVTRCMTLPDIDTVRSLHYQWRSAIRGQPRSNRLSWSYANIEWPSFSILPALRSLNVLDIDEPAYLEEMSSLVSRSIDCLREIRISLAIDVPRMGFTSSRMFDFPDDHCEWSTYKGALSLILSKIYFCNHRAGGTASGLPEVYWGKTSPALRSNTCNATSTPNGRRPDHADDPADPSVPVDSDARDESEPLQCPCSDGPPWISVKPMHQEPKLLRLEVIELERINIAVPMMLATIDLSFVTSLTLLSCDSHEKLWKSLRRKYTPRLMATTIEGSSTFSMRLRKLHTNTVSSALMAFLKETLAPNSLETLILQDGGMVEVDEANVRNYYESAISIGTICRGPLRRHRSSLKKVLIDSTQRTPNGSTRDSTWRRWKCDRDSLSHLTSGKMSALRELSFSLDYKDWHFFLQRLPQVSHIRSIHITNITNHARGHYLDTKELALQVMDTVALRPEIELCFIGIRNKCYRITEGRFNDDATVSFHIPDTGPTSYSESGSGSDEESEEDDEENDDHDNVDQPHAANGPQHSGNSDSEEGSFEGSDNESEDGDTREREPIMKLREILFYDEKVTIFKARHAKL
ncbi:MAG: hypothetical protein Q9215_000650 [Flavoplaca cf. flavocitrina]